MNYLIIGFGAAGANAAEELRRQDPEAQITVLNDEPYPFYLRLDLEALFFGKPVEQLMPRPESFWVEQRVTIVSDRAIRVDRQAKTVYTKNKAAFSYDKLLIAIGAQPVFPAWPGRDLKGICVYRSLDDALTILNSRDQVKKVVIVGGGILGMELAYVANHIGWHSTLLVRRKHLGSPLLDPAGGEFVLKKMRKKGVVVHFEEEVSAFLGKDGRLTSVQTTKQQTLEADLAVVCVGVKPDLSFLPVDLLTDGKLVVNTNMQTPDDSIFAAGDAILIRSESGKLIPSFTWKAAASQAQVASINMCGGNEAWQEGILYDLDTFFDLDFSMIGKWSERHEAGYSLQDFSTDDAYRKLVFFDGKLCGAMLVGDRAGDRRIRKLIADGGVVDGEIEAIFR